jgi:FkbM family methyltransferase
MTGSPMTGSPAADRAARDRAAPLVVVDGGARGGLRDLPRLAPRLDVHAFEPDAEACRALAACTGYHALTAVPQALAGTVGRRTLHLTRHRSLSSFLAPDPIAYETHCGRMSGYAGWRRAIDVVDRVEVETTTLDAWAAASRSGHVDFLKLDTQGTELEILGGGRALLDAAGVAVLRLEVAFLGVYQGQALFPAVDRYLTEAGYQFVDISLYPDRVRWRGWSAARYVEPPRWAAGGDATYACPPERWPGTERATRATAAAEILAHLGYPRAAVRWLRAAGFDDDGIDARLTAWTTRTPRERREARLRRWLPPALWRR